LFPDFSDRLWIDFARRDRGLPVADKNHHMTALAAPFFSSEQQPLFARLVSQLSDELIALVHRRRRIFALGPVIGQKCPKFKRRKIPLVPGQFRFGQAIPPPRSRGEVRLDRSR
jgi:hypothetical protein